MPIILFLTSCNFKTSMDYNDEAEKLEREEKYEEAIILLNIAIEKDSKNIYALLNRAVDKSLLKKYNEAIIDYSKVIEINPDNTLAYLNRGKNKSRLGKYDDAIKDYNLAIKTKGSELNYLNKVENLLIEDGFEFDVEMKEIRYERGFSRYKIDSLKTAFEDFDFCIQMNYELSDCYLWRGNINLAYDNHNEACEDYNNALKLGNNKANGLIKKYCKQ